MPFRPALLLRALSRRHIFSAALVACVSLIVNSAIALHNGIPQPRVQDEFSYLLAADTFAHGRLTNPTPPFSEHFETPHVLVRPTYMSKYPPARGLALAIGQLCSGHSIIGVWFASAAATAAVYWMILAFLPAPCALLGGIITALHPQMLAWSQTYWGGSVAVLGSALVIGSWGRLMTHHTITTVILFGLGLIILANSRPYEGFVLSLPLTLLLLQRRTRVLVIPLVSILLIAAICMAYYNFRITGHPLRMPFMEYSSQYDIYPKFWFLPKHSRPNYSSPAIARIHTDYEPGDYDRLRTPAGLLSISARRLWQLISMHTRAWFLLVPPLAAAITLIRDPKLKWIWITLAIFFIGLCAENFFLPNYAAPVTPIFLLLIIAAWNQLWTWTRSTRIVAATTMVAWLIASVLSAAAAPPPDALRFGRADLIAEYPQLQTGRHLIFVEYTPGHLLHDEWVYNAADLEHSQIIWARAFGKTADEPLMKYFNDRQHWLLKVGESQLRFDRYP